MWNLHVVHQMCFTALVYMYIYQPNHTELCYFLVFIFMIVQSFQYLEYKWLLNIIIN